MAMEINGNLIDYAARNQNYNSYTAQNTTGNRAAENMKKKEAKKVSEASGSNESKSMAEYAKELAKLVPSVEFKVGNSFSTDKSGKTLTISPQLLEKMQNDPEKEKEMKELIKGVESAINLIDSINKGTGWTVVYKHSYIDKNGQYRSIAYLRNDFMLNMSDKLREERKENSEKLLERQKEKAAEKKEELEELSEEKTAAVPEEGNTKKTEDKAAENPEKETVQSSAYRKAKQILSQKMAASEEGTIYLGDMDIQAIIEAAHEDNTDKTTEKHPVQIGANLDLKI